ncbi:unnamed protein product [Allacma fusca]|uniref:Uncharacterized protein n=1 Tax=Allacma fusca TaxID=39272 RepID=A0A8J2P646_9HEXA|nr:unnamed protein product [Allacma fusca]
MTTANANQFIGSKISLISKSEIRYEGILYSLDLQEATISLAKVKSFGTEDRPTERPVPHKEEIYEFIIFRGADIKGIDVLEPPKATATLTSGLPNDPAIVEVSHYHSSGQSSQPPTSSVGAQGASYPSALTGSYSQGFGAASSTLLSGVKPVQQGNSFLDLIGRSNASTPSLYSNRKSPTNDAGVQVSNEEKGRNNRQFSNRQGEGRGSRHSSQDRRRQPRQQQQGNDRQGGYQPRGRGNFVNNRGGFRGGRGGNRGGYRSQGIIQAQNPPKVTFEDAYDFEKANEELSKLKIRPEDLEKKEGEQEGGDVNNTEEEQENKEPPEPYYVKDSFYDKISCESTERGKGRTTRIDWRAERKLNAETFGLPANSGQRRGYQRGGGYRGGFRGGYQGSPRGGFQQRGGYGGYNTGYGYGNNGGWQYNNRYNGGRGNRGGYRQQQQNQPQSQQQPAQ